MINHEDILASLAAEASGIEKSFAPRAALVDAGWNVVFSVGVGGLIAYLFGLDPANTIATGIWGTTTANIYQAGRREHRFKQISKYLA